MLEYLHLLTFLSWIPLALLAWTQKGDRAAAQRLWALCGVTFLLCGYVFYLEFVWSKTVVAPIRVDLLFLIPVSTVTFMAVGVWGLRKPGVQPRVASIALLALSLPTLLIFAQGMWSSSKDIGRLNARPGLIFEAQFRNPQTFGNFFGNVDKKDDPRVGHFRAEEPDGWASRVIVNDQGHVWIMFRCEAKTECVYAQADLEARPMHGTFSAKPEAGLPLEVVATVLGQDRFSLTFSAARSATFVRAPVPYQDTASAPATVTFHGAFSQSRIDGNAIYLVQIWLWQSGDRWLAYYVRQNAMCGSTNDFVLVSAYKGTPVSDQIDFKGANDGDSVETFQIRQPAPASNEVDGQVLYNGRPLQSIALTRNAVLHSPVYESAPLADFDATAGWLKIVSMGYFLSWKAECRM